MKIHPVRIKEKDVKEIPAPVGLLVPKPLSLRLNLTEILETQKILVVVEELPHSAYQDRFGYFVLVLAMAKLLHYF